MIVMNDFKQEYQHAKPEIDRAIQEVLDSAYYILGNKTKQFEQAFASYIGTTYAVGVANGLEAIQLALMALGIGAGDEVITVSNSAVATTLAITNVGATPVFVDIDEYYHLDTGKLESAITPKTKAILPVHLFGQMVDIVRILEIARAHGVALIEDACQAHGASFKDKKAGSFGIMGCFSFYPTKNLGTYGDGGAITTGSKELYEKLIKLRNYGQSTRYYHDVVGMNSRLDEIHAAILLAKLPTLDTMIAARKKIADRYLEQLQGIDQIQFPKIREGYQHAFHLFVISVPDRDALQASLKEQGIDSLIHYPVPIHKQACYPAFHTVELPSTEYQAEHILSLPIHPFLTDAEVDTVAASIRSYYQLTT